MAERAKHAFGKSSGIESAIQAGKIDAFDILFLDSDTDPKVGWIDKNGNPVVVESVTEVKGQVAELETELATKAGAEEVEALESQIATKVDTKTVQSMIEEYTKSAIEVIEF